MRGSKNFCQAGGGGGVEALMARKQSGQCFFSHQLILQFTEWIQWFYYRGEGGSRPDGAENSLDNVFSVINLFYSLQIGSNGLLQRGGGGPTSSRGRGVSKETHITCDFPWGGGGGGGVRTPNPPSGSARGVA